MTDSHTTGHPRPVLLDALAAEVTGLFGAFGFDVSEDTVRGELLTFAANVNDLAGTEPRAYPYPYPMSPTDPATGKRYGLAAFGYHIETQDETGEWVVAHTGTTDPYHFRPDQTALDSIAQTLYGNAGYVLGLRPTDPMPVARVRTWYAPEGPFGLADEQTRLTAGVAPTRLEALEAVERGDLRPGATPAQWKIIGDLAADGMIETLTSPGHVEYRLTKVGEKELASLWGPDRVPPGKGGYLDCPDHNVYEAGPGDWWACPRCPTRVA